MLREISKKICLVANFGTAYTGLATVGYKLLNGDGSTFQARTTTGVAEIVAGTGIYRVEVANSIFTADFDGYVQWDTGGGSPVYAAEDVHIVAELDATVSSRSTYAGADTSGTTTLLSRLTSGRATNLDNLDAAVSTRLAASSYTDPSTALAAILADTAAILAAIPADVLDEIVTGHTITDSVGALLQNLDVAVSTRLASTADPTSALNTILTDIQLVKANTDLLGTGIVTFGGPVLNAGRVEIVQGDDYLEIDGRALAWTSTSWPDLTSATVTLDIIRTVHPHTTQSYPSDIPSATQVDVELTALETAALAAGTWNFALKAVLADLSQVTLAQGIMVVLIAPAP